MLNLNLIVRLFSFIMSTNLLFYFFGILYIMYYIDINIDIYRNINHCSNAIF